MGFKDSTSSPLADSSRQSGQKPSAYKFWEWFKLSDRQGGYYLRRLRVVQTPRGAIYFHRIDGPDPDLHPHDHPWNFVSIVLRGGYIERVFDGKRNYLRRHGFGSVHFMPAAKKAHQIITVMPGCTTIILTGKRQRDWGFWTNVRPWFGTDKKSTGWQQWEEYLRETYGRSAFKEPMP